MNMFLRASYINPPSFMILFRHSHESGNLDGGQVATFVGMKATEKRSPTSRERRHGKERFG